MVSKGVGKEEGIFLRLYQFFFLPRHFSALLHRLQYFTGQPK